MANPTYNRGYGFAGYQATRPASPLPGSRLDNELDNIALVAANHRARLAALELLYGVVTGETATDVFIEMLEDDEVEDAFHALFDVWFDAAASTMPALTAQVNAAAASATAAAGSATTATTKANDASDSAADAAQSAADAALDGGAASPLPDGVLSAVYENALVAADGNLIVGQLKNTVVPDSGNSLTSVYAEGLSYGTRIVLEASVDGAGTVAYTGHLYDGILWLNDPQDLGGGDYSANVSFDRKEAPQLSGYTYTFNSTTQGEITSALTDDFVPVYSCLTQSFGAGIGFSAGLISTSAVDTGVALMPGLSGSSGQYTPRVGFRTFQGTLIDCREDGTVSSGGETLCSGFMRKGSALETARGAKFTSVISTNAIGGQELFQLIEGNTLGNPDTAADRHIYWQDFTRTQNHIHKLVTSQLGKIPVCMPLLVPAPGVTESSDPVTDAAEFEKWLTRLHRQWNDFSRRLYGWSPAAPDLPIIITPPSRTAENTYTSTTKELSFDLGGPLLGCWRAFKLNPNLVFAGPDYHIPPHTDNTHPSPLGMNYLGEMMRRCMDAIVHGRGWFPCAPHSFDRVSNTQFVMSLTMNSGNAAIDTSIVTDYANSSKGIVIWDILTGTEVTVSNVTVTGADRNVTIDINSTFGSGTSVANRELAIDYAMWRDLSTGVNFGNVAGARGCIKSSTAYTTEAPGGVDQYDWCLPFRERLPISNGQTFHVKRAN